MIVGSSRSVAYGASITLTAEITRADSMGRNSAAMRGTWRLRGVGACLASPASPGDCLPEVTGTAVRFSPPATGPQPMMFDLGFEPGDGGPAINTSLLGTNFDDIPINGAARAMGIRQR